MLANKILKIFFSRTTGLRLEIWLVHCLLVIYNWFKWWSLGPRKASGLSQEFLGFPNKYNGKYSKFNHILGYIYFLFFRTSRTRGLLTGFERSCYSVVLYQACWNDTLTVQNVPAPRYWFLHIRNWLKNTLRTSGTRGLFFRYSIASWTITNLIQMVSQGSKMTCLE